MLCSVYQCVNYLYRCLRLLHRSECYRNIHVVKHIKTLVIMHFMKTQLDDRQNGKFTPKEKFYIQLCLVAKS